MPRAWLSIDTHRSRRSLKMALCLAMKSCGPSRASAAAHCDTAVGFEVDCDCTIAIALINGSRPPGVTDAPAGHAICLRDAVHRQRAIVEARLDLRRGGEFELVIDEVLV